MRFIVGCMKDNKIKEIYLIKSFTNDKDFIKSKYKLINFNTTNDNEVVIVGVATGNDCYLDKKYSHMIASNQHNAVNDYCLNNANNGINPIKIDIPWFDYNDYFRFSIVL